MNIPKFNNRQEEVIWKAQHYNELEQKLLACQTDRGNLQAELFAIQTGANEKIVAQQARITELQTCAKHYYVLRHDRIGDPLAYAFTKRDCNLSKWREIWTKTLRRPRNQPATCQRTGHKRITRGRDRQGTPSWILTAPE